MGMQYCYLHQEFLTIVLIIKVGSFVIVVALKRAIDGC